MNQNSIIQQTADHVKEKFLGEGSGHDWWHIYRVWQNAKLIEKTEKVDMFVVELGALLHDIADFKFHDGDEEIGPKTASEWLQSLNVDKDIIDHVAEIVRHISYKGANVENKIQ